MKRLLLPALLLAAAAPALAGTGASRDLLALGRKVYLRECTGCHGEAGDGKGPAAGMLVVKPRDFTRGIYKFRTTPTSQLPTDEDLYRTITRGVNRTAMPGFPLLPEMERVALVGYVKGFSEKFGKLPPPSPIAIPQPPASLGSPDSVARGREVYLGLGCDKCHGAGGRGDGPSAGTMAPDVWGDPQKPFDFTSGYLKSGPSPRDVYRTFMTGLNGTGMPSFGMVFDYPDGVNIREGDSWHLVSYVLSLRRHIPARKAPGPSAPGAQGGSR